MQAKINEASEGGFTDTGFEGRERLSSATGGDSEVPIAPALQFIKNQVRSPAEVMLF